MFCSNLPFPYLQQQQKQQQYQQRKQPDVVCRRKIQKSNAITQALQDLERLPHDCTNFGYIFLISCIFSIHSSVCYYLTCTLAKSWLSACSFSKVKEFNVKIFYMTVLILVGCGVKKGQR
jgi:hypothetical protein